MAARTKFAAAIAAVAALWAAMLLCGCGGEEYGTKIFTNTLENGETYEIELAPMVGYYMETVDGVPYFFSEDDSAVGYMVGGDLVTRRDDISLDSFTNGDKIVVWWYLIEEVSPPHVIIYAAELVEEGDVDSLPQSVKDEIEKIKSPTRYFSPDDLPVLIHEEHTFTRTLPSGETEEVTVSSTNGYLLITNNGTCIFARYHDDPNDGVVVIGQKDDAMFAGLTSGDRVLVWFDGPIRESYPGQGTIFTIAKMMDGSMDALPKAVQTHVKLLESLGRTFAE